MYPIDAELYPDVMEAYIARVKALFATVMASPRHETEPFNCVRRKFIEFSGFDYGEDGSVEVQQGFLDAIRAAPAAGLSQDLLEHWRAELARFSPPFRVLTRWCRSLC